MNLSKPQAVETIDRGWRGLYTVGGAAALIAAVLFRRNLDAEYMLLRSLDVLKGGPNSYPESIIDWFRVVNENRVVGLVLLNFFDLVNYILVGAIFIALFAALKPGSRSSAMIAVVVGLVGVTLYLGSNQALTILSLSERYMAAKNGIEREIIMAAGQATLAIHQNNNYSDSGIYLSFLFVTVSGLIYSVAMLQTRIFSRGTAITGILANSIGLVYYIFLFFIPKLVSVPVSASAIFLLIWYFQIGIVLLRLGKRK